jgi:hypothetical protein
VIVLVLAIRYFSFSPTLLGFMSYATLTLAALHGLRFWFDIWWTFDFYYPNAELKAQASASKPVPG